MKLFLTTSIVAMIAAGIFGVYDFSKDVKEGNYIVYEEEEELSNEASFSSGRNSKAISVNNVVNAVEETFSANTKKKVIKEEYFSRGEPIEFVEEVVAEQTPAPNEKIETKKEVAPVKVITADRKVEKTEKRKFSYKLYSRGAPPRIEEEEVVVVAAVDSTKKE